MRPATSGRSVTDSSERRLPTAVIVCGSACRDDLGRFDGHRRAGRAGAPRLGVAPWRPATSPGSRCARCAPNQKPAPAATQYAQCCGGDDCSFIHQSGRFFEQFAGDRFATAIINYALRCHRAANRSVAYASTQVGLLHWPRCVFFGRLSMLQPDVSARAIASLFASRGVARCGHGGGNCRHRRSPSSPHRPVRSHSRRRPAKLVVPFPPGGPLDVVGAGSRRS